MFDLAREIMQTLRNNKLRTALTGFAVAWGIFMLIVLLSLANGLIHSFEANMLSRDTNLLQIWGGATTKAFKGYKEGRNITLNTRDLPAIADADRRYIREVSAEITGDSITFRSGNESTSGYMGAYPSQKASQGLEIVAGRFINDADMLGQRKSLVINETTATAMFASPDSAVGRRLTGAGLSWVVVGVYKHKFRQGNYIPYTLAETLAGGSGDLNTVYVNIDHVETQEQGEQLQKDVLAAVARRHEFAPDDEGALWINNRYNDSLSAQTVMHILVMAMWVIGVLTLLSGIIGVSNIMFVSVRERVHEIGIRRAIGAKRRSILTQIVAESVCITTLFGYIGIVMGTVVMAIVNMVIGNSLEMLQNPTVDLKVAVEVTVILIIAGALAGLFPALKATKVRPVEALRDE